MIYVFKVSSENAEAEVFLSVCSRTTRPTYQNPVTNNSSHSKLHSIPCLFFQFMRIVKVQIFKGIAYTLDENTFLKVFTIKSKKKRGNASKKLNLVNMA